MKLRTLYTLLLLAPAAPAFSQPTAGLIEKLDGKLTRVETTVTKILTDTSLLYLHSLTPFREMIRQHALPEKIRLDADNEPGTRITVKGIVVDSTGHPQTNSLVYVYQTSARGWYSDTGVHILQNEGDRRHARLFGYFKTDGFGKFEFLTVKPSGYPSSALPAHIHIEITPVKGRKIITELLFDDDPRLAGEIRERSIKEKFLIAKDSGTAGAPVYTYRIVSN